MKNVYKSNLAARNLASQVLEGESPRQALRHIGRMIEIKRDRSDDAYYGIPVYDYDTPTSKSGFVNLFRPKTNPKQELKNRLNALVRERKGYKVGDTFKSPWGLFRVTDDLTVKEL